MKHISEAAAKAARHRTWHWCRHENGFCDRPTWRVVARRLSMPVHQVVAFVCRLEELANAADQRGQVGHFRAAEFAEALDMPEEDAARIFAELEAPDIAWVAYECVATFFDRNRDWEDDTAAVRKRKQRARDNILKRLVTLGRQGKFDPARRTEIEGRLMLMDADELSTIQTELRDAELSTGHRRHTVTSRADRPATETAFAAAEFSTGHRGHSVTPRDIVTVTTEQSRKLEASAVDNFGDGARGASAGLSDQGDVHEQHAAMAAAERWIAVDGMRIVKERMEFDHARAETVLTRWLDQQLEGDAIALAEVIRAADATDYIGPRFHNLVVDGIARAKRHAQPQQQLALGPVPLKTAGGRDG